MSDTCSNSLDSECYNLYMEWSNDPVDVVFNIVHTPILSDEAKSCLLFCKQFFHEKNAETLNTVQFSSSTHVEVQSYIAHMAKNSMVPLGVDAACVQHGSQIY